MNLKNKISLLISLLVLVILLATSILLLFFEKEHLVNESKSNKIVLTKALRRVSRDSMLRKDSLFLINYMKTLKEGNKTIQYALFIDKDDRILAHTNPRFLRQITKDPIYLKSLNSEEPLFQTYHMFSEPKSSEIIDVSLPVFFGDEKEGIVHIGFSKAALNEKINAMLRKTFQRILITVSIVLTFGFLCVLLLAHTIAKPIKMLAEGATLIGQGKLDTKIQLKGRDELAWLAGKFNKMAEELKELDQMKKDFVSNVTHELRSPLAAIETYINKMQDEDKEEFEKTGLEDLTIMKNNAVRLTRFIDNLLDVAKIESDRILIEPMPFDVSSVANEVIALFKLKAEEKKISLEARMPEDLPEAFGDVEKIRQVFVNLISNSLKFTPVGGAVSVAACHMMNAPPEYIQIRVNDTGMGIPEKDFNRIFDKFQQVKEMREKVQGAKGTGLGLYIVKNIVELHGGRVWVESKLGKGSTFIFTLPTKNAKISNKSYARK